MNTGSALLGIIGPLAGVVVGSVLTYATQHLGKLHVFVYSSRVTFSKRVSQSALASEERLPDGRVRRFGFHDGWEEAHYSLHSEVYNGSQSQKILRNVCLIVRDRHHDIGAAAFLNVPAEPRTMRIPPYGIETLTASVGWKKGTGLTEKSGAYFSYYTVHNRRKLIRLEKPVIPPVLLAKEPPKAASK